MLGGVGAMLDMFKGFLNSHTYTMSFERNGRIKSKTFRSRSDANNAMYRLIGKHKLSIEKIYDDHHYKTYICNDGIKFYINRD